MKLPRICPKFPGHLAAQLVIAGGFMVALSGCKESKPGAAPGAAASGADVQQPGKPAEKPVEVPSIPPLSPMLLDQLPQQCVLIRGANGQYATGVVVFQDAGSSPGSSRQLIAASTSPDSDKVRLAYRRAAGSVAVGSGKREMVLPNGLSLYSTTLNGTFRPGDAAPAQGRLHACRLSGQGSVDEKERTELEAKLAPLRERLEELNAQQRDAIQDRGRTPASRREAMRGGHDSSMEQSKLGLEISQLSGRLEMPFDSISPEETASGATTEALEKSAASLEGTVLANLDGAVGAIRHDGKWIGTRDLMPEGSGSPAGVSLRISGSNQTINVSCDIEWALPFSNPACSMVAATTYELESLQGADIAERLSKVEATQLSFLRTKSAISRSCDWNGKPTSLWIRVFKDADPTHPIIDEMVLVDYQDRFSARWGKPPSPLIKRAADEADSPADLLRESNTVDAQGTILDMVAAGDGSVLIVQTDRPPFWAPFDLKTGRFEEAPWKAGPDTLVAAQAGKVYLIDRKSKVLEIWDLASKKRTGLQILAVEGDLVAAAAPLASASSPLLVTSLRTALFFDPVHFDPMSTGLSLGECFSAGEQRSNLPRIDPTSVHLRTSEDGALYLMEGRRSEGQGRDALTVSIKMDASSTATAGVSSSRSMLTTHGRRITRDYPDHGGSNVQLRAQSNSKAFPSPPGMIRFTEGNGKTIAELRNVPVSPSESAKSSTPFPRDRALYFDSSHDVLVAPDGDKLHVLRLNLPELSQALPDFAFSGEELEIRLPPGRDHKLVLPSGENAGKAVIEGNFVKWTMPESASRGQADLTLEWTAELGSTMTRPIQCQLVGRSSRPHVESTDGKTKIFLKRAGEIPHDDGIRGFAGSGEVALTNSRGACGAWNLSTCERIFTLTEKSVRSFFGDADQLYIFKSDNILKSFDLRTGELLKEATFGDTSQGEGLAGITTGISSRGPLLAVETDDMNRYLAMVDRKTLKSHLLKFPRETQQLFFITDFRTNPSGLASWTSRAGVFRKGDDISVQSFEKNPRDGTPDASGRFLVANEGIVDLEPSPPVLTKISELLGNADSVECSLDVSGQYLLLMESSSRPGQTVVSVREVVKFKEELFKLIVPSHYDRSTIHVISEGHKVIFGNSQLTNIYHFDIPAMVAKLAAGTDEP